jgi:hypothetical protein
MRCRVKEIIVISCLKQRKPSDTSAMFLLLGALLGCLLIMGWRALNKCYERCSKTEEPDNGPLTGPDDTFLDEDTANDLDEKIFHSAAPTPNTPKLYPALHLAKISKQPIVITKI